MVGRGRDGLFAKTTWWGFLLCFVLAWSSSSGPSDMLAAPRGTPLSAPASVTKDAWTRSAPCEARSPRLALSQSQARPPATQMLCAFSFASRDPGVCGSTSSLRVRVCACLCACVYLKRTGLSCLICTMGGGLEWPARQLCARRWCSEGKLLRDRGFQDDVCDHLCFFVVFNLDKTALERGSLMQVIGLSLSRFQVLATGLQTLTNHGHFTFSEHCSLLG